MSIFTPVESDQFQIGTREWWTVSVYRLLRTIRAELKELEQSEEMIICQVAQEQVTCSTGLCWQASNPSVVSLRAAVGTPRMGAGRLLTTIR
jgi:hypothetical protein